MPDEKLFNEIKMQQKYKCKKDKSTWVKFQISADGFFVPYDVERAIMQHLADVPCECWDNLYHRLCKAERKYEKELSKYMGNTPYINDYIDKLKHIEQFNRMIALGMFGEKGIEYIPTIILELPLVKVILICINPELKTCAKMELSPKYDYCFAYV